MDLLGLSKVTVLLTTGEAIRNSPFFLLLRVCWIHEPKVTRIREKTRVIYDSIFLAAPETDSRV
jgi:hypothetical protein